jgi:hypothetical protein
MHAHYLWASFSIGNIFFLVCLGAQSALCFWCTYCVLYTFPNVLFGWRAQVFLVLWWWCFLLSLVGMTVLLYRGVQCRYRPDRPPPRLLPPSLFLARSFQFSGLFSPMVVVQLTVPGWVPSAHIPVHPVQVGRECFLLLQPSSFPVRSSYLTLSDPASWMWCLLTKFLCLFLATR